MRLVDSRDAWEFWAEPESAGPEPRGALARIRRAFAGLLLSGLTSIEVISLAVACIAGVGFSWMAGLLDPESLITDRWIRSTWAVLVISVLRPITWIPYALLFLSLRRVADGLAARRSTALRNASANLGTIGVLALAAWLVFVAVPGSATAVSSVLAFVTGSGSFEDLGAVGADWDPLRVAAVAVGALLLRVVVPPLGRDFDLLDEPILGFVSGARGRFDRIALITVIVVAVVLGGVGAVLAIRG
jgi:hypothetical protein